MIKKLFSIFVFLFLVIGVSYGATSISSCQTLSASTEYEITANVTATGTCFDFGGSNVIVTCLSGVWINGNTTGFGFDLGDTTIDNLTIQDCNINNFTEGIHILDTTAVSHKENIIILNNNIYNTVSEGIYINIQTAGNRLKDSLIDSNSIYTCGDEGIQVLGFEDTDIVNNYVTDCDTGLSLAQGFGTSDIYQNNIQNSGTYSMDCYSSFGGTITAYDNIFNDTEDAGCGVINFNTTYNCASTNILGGDCVGGNFWSDFTCTTDLDSDGICDTPSTYGLAGGGGRIDRLPLTTIAGGGAGVSNLSYSCSPYGGSDCTDSFNANTITAIVSDYRIEDEPTANPLFNFYRLDNSKNLPVDIWKVASVGSNHIGTTNYSVISDCVEGSTCLQVYKNIATNTLSLDKTVNYDSLDNDGDQKFNHIWLNLPTEMLSHITNIYFYYGDSNLNNYYRVEMKNDFGTGWNVITEKWGQIKSQRLYTTVGSPDESAIEKIRVELVYDEFATYSNPITLDYIFAQEFKQEKSGADYTHFIIFDDADTNLVELLGQAFGVTKVATFNMTTVGAIESQVFWDYNYYPNTTYNASQGAQKLCLDFVENTSTTFYDSMTDEPSSDGAPDTTLEIAGDSNLDASYSTGLLIKGAQTGLASEVNLNITGSFGNPEDSNFIYNIRMCETTVNNLTTTVGIASDCSGNLVDVAQNINLSSIIGTSTGIISIPFDVSYSMSSGTKYILIFKSISGSDNDTTNDFWRLSADTNASSLQYKRCNGTGAVVEGEIGDFDLLSYTDTINGATCTINTLYNQTLAYNYYTSETGDGYCANVPYYTNGDWDLTGFCEKSGYNNAFVYFTTTVTDSPYLDLYTYINVKSNNFMYYIPDSIIGNQEVCVLDGLTMTYDCCTLDKYSGTCTISITSPFTLSSTATYMSDRNRNEAFMHINPFSVKNGVYEQDIYFVTTLAGISRYSLVNNTLDCNVSNFAGNNYKDLNLQGNNISLYDCRSTTCSKNYNKGFFDYILKYPTKLIPSWFKQGATSNFMVLAKHNITCTDTTAGTNFCTEGKNYNSAQDMLTNMNLEYSAYPDVLEYVQLMFNCLNEPTSVDCYGIDPDNPDLSLTGSIITCNDDCTVDIQTCDGTCDSDGNCVPFVQTQNNIRTLFGYFTDNEANFALYWMIITIAVAGIIGMVSRSGVGIGIGFIMMLITGAVVGVLPTFMSIGIVTAVIILLILYVAIKMFKGGET